MLHCRRDFFYYRTHAVDPNDYEHAKVPLNVVPEEIIKQHDLSKIAVNDRVYFEIRKGMSDLKQAGNVANIHIGKHPNIRGCVQSNFVPSLWKYKTLPGIFTLMIDKFGVKDVGKNGVNVVVICF